VRFGKELSQVRCFLRWTVDRFHELLPLFFVKNESRLIGERFFGLPKGGADDKVGDVQTSPLGRNFDRDLLVGCGAELEPPDGSFRGRRAWLTFLRRLNAVS
jgi:hypothetical protein